MATANYLINLMVQTGGSVSGIVKVGAAADRAAGGVNRLQLASYRAFMGINEGFQRAVEHAARFAEHLAFAGAVASIGAVAWAVNNLDNQFERMRVGLAGDMLMGGVTKDMPDALARSSNLFRQMRKDSESLPLEFRDLVKVMQGSMIPGLATGASISQLRVNAGRAATLGAMNGVSPESAATGLLQLYAGNIRATNRIGIMIGLGNKDMAQKFRAMAAPERFKYIEDGLKKLDPAIKEFANSYIGLSTTLKTHVMTFAERATGGLMEHVKTTLKEVNSWFTSEKGNVWADRIGRKLVIAFDWAKAKVLEWGPLLVDFAGQAYTKIVALADRFSPVIAGLKDLFKNGEIWGKLNTLKDVYIGSKVAGFGLNAAFGRGMGRGGIGMGGAAMTGLGATGAVIGGGLLLGAGGVLNTYVMSMDKSSNYQNIASAATANLTEEWKHLTLSTGPLVTAFDAMSLGATGVAVALTGMVNWLIDHSGFGGPDDLLPDSTKAAIAVTGKTSASLLNMLEIMDAKYKYGSAPVVDRMKKSLEGTGQTNIGQVNFQISGSMEPSRIARVAASALAEIRKHPTASPYVDNWGETNK